MIDLDIVSGKKAIAQAEMAVYNRQKEIVTEVVKQINKYSEGDLNKTSVYSEVMNLIMNSGQSLASLQRTHSILFDMVYLDYTVEKTISNIEKRIIGP